MAYDPNTGIWKPDETSVEKRVRGLLKHDNPLMQKAATAGTQQKTRRGLGNSSMAVGAAQSAMMDYAVPIASQDAQQANQRYLQGRDSQGQQRIAQMQMATAERGQAASLAAEFERNYATILASTMQNHEMPSSARESLMRHAATMRDSNMRLVEQMYGISLKWAGQNTPAGAGGASTTPAAPVSWAGVPRGNTISDALRRLYTQYGQAPPGGTPA